MFRVLLQSRGNPDFGQDPRRPLSPELTVTVASLREASRACRAYIEEHDLGGGSWTGGEVRDAATGRVVARVSYNGRVWPPEEWFPGQQPLEV